MFLIDYKAVVMSVEEAVFAILFEVRIAIFLSRKSKQKCANRRSS